MRGLWGSSCFLRCRARVLYKSVHKSSGVGRAAESPLHAPRNGTEVLAAMGDPGGGTGRAAASGEQPPPWIPAEEGWGDA